MKRVKSIVKLGSKNYIIEEWCNRLRPVLMDVLVLYKVGIMFDSAKKLIAENDDVLLEAYANFFTNANFEVVTASNGVDALVLIKSNNYDIVLADNCMPLLTGVELLAKCQVLAKKLPKFILNTGHSDFGCLGDTSNFFAVLRKGTDAVKLLATVEKAIGRTVLVH